MWYRAAVLPCPRVNVGRGSVLAGGFPHLINLSSLATPSIRPSRRTKEKQTMPDNRISAILSAGDRQAVLDALQTIRQKLPFLVDLSPEERRS